MTWWPHQDRGSTALRQSDRVAHLVADERLGAREQDGYERLCAELAGGNRAALRAFIDVMKSEGWRRSVGGAMLEERLTERDDGQTAARFVAKALADTGLG